MFYKLTSQYDNFSRGCPEVRHLFMYRNLDKNIRSFMAMIQGVPAPLLALFKPKFISFLADLIPPVDDRIRKLAQDVRADLLASGADLRGHAWMTLFAAQHILSFQHARDVVINPVDLLLGVISS